ncbi:hypothetical protein B0A53_01904 [Rhodotorula sp. CCFEE 5036]|nr:hypothetical protein B0A53_01904 [Rhodotorula sp. CCFEE 5036]
MLPDKSEPVLDVDAVSADRSSESRFADPNFLLSELAGNAPDELNLEQERLNLVKAHDWFVESNVRGSHETSRTRPLEPPHDVVSWSGYGRAALDADALFMAEWRDRYGPTFANLETTPTRVLDVGCGVYGQWILAAAQAPGWEATRFVGLDLAPVLVPASMLPAAVRSRVVFVQHDVLQPLPFQDGQFDYIRCCGVTAGVPGPSLVQHKPSWDILLEELKRCLAPGGKLEVADTPSRPILPPRLREEFDTMLEKHLLNVNLRGVIPATLAMNDMHDVEAPSDEDSVLRPPPNSATEANANPEFAAGPPSGTSSPRSLR